MPMATRLALFRQVLEGLRNLHAAGIMHRDISPQNLLVFSHQPPTAAICDFGKSKQGTKGNKTSLGPPAFTAPEVGNQEEYTNSIDVFSLGLSMLATFTAWTWPGPMSSPNNHTMILEHLASLQGRMPDDLGALLRSMLAWDPGDRLTAEQALADKVWEPVAVWSGSEIKTEIETQSNAEGSGPDPGSTEVRLQRSGGPSLSSPGGLNKRGRGSEAPLLSGKTWAFDSASTMPHAGQPGTDNAIRKRPQIIQFMTDHEVALGDVRLTAEDWDFLGKAHNFLQPFTSSTLYAEGHSSSISQSLVLMDALLAHYERQKDLYSQQGLHDSRMLRAIEMGWFVIDKYYNKTSEAPVYAAALLLNPRNRAAYLHKNWPVSWHEDAIDSANVIWEEEYKALALDSESTDSEPNQAFPVAKIPRNELDRLLECLQVETTRKQNADNFMAFIQDDATDLNGQTPLEWWCQPEQRRLYPRLSQMAIAILSIPAESSEPEQKVISYQCTLMD
ncbi:kinase-like domain-containing protein [Diaporthe sp. PMI_573]|nr:kinase-like domain-containing protein [Diaporthaceae sp. PMI_573]